MGAANIWRRFRKRWIQKARLKSLKNKPSKIKEGKLKVLNSDGTFRCPFSPNKRKQSYKFSEIL
jgi:hypothetical protein